MCECVCKFDLKIQINWVLGFAKQMTSPPEIRMKQQWLKTTRIVFFFK